MMEQQEELLETAQQSLKQQLQTLVKEDIKQFKETRKEFERGSESLGSALHHNAEVPRRRQHDAEEAATALKAARTNFRNRALDYVLQINVIQSKKKFEILKFLHELVLESAREKRDMEQRHAVIKQKDLSQDDDVPEIQAEPGQVVTEGYLYKRASNAFKTWSRTCLLQADSERHLQAWMCSVQNSIASAYNEDRPEPAGQFLERSASMTASTLQSPSSRKLRGGVDKQVVDQVQRLEGNAQCCDCREAAPEWASINLGITLCIECSGIHRSLGVHFSKVRSLTLDAWEPELVKLMTVLGNRVINQIYEARVEEMNMKRPQPGSSRTEKEAWIRAKYVERKFITKFPNAGAPPSRSREPGGQERSPRPFPKPKPPGQIRRGPGLREGLSPSRAPPASEDLRHLHPGALLYRAAGAPPSLPTMSDALAHGADVNWVNTGQENRTPLLQAVSANSLLACEFLLQNGANVNQSDSKGRGPLHHATILGHTGLACLFLKRGANMKAVDGEGKDPLGIAIDSANADIVTLLRLAKMREAEMALGQSGDDTYLDIFQDFSLMASNDPEKLARKSYDFKLTTL
ncbi:PREDICTED: arf-GAP with coiled-coil, ANK repeat and PH domain-containing protein 1-like [Thamnophis sirtalis]|uniref:Arf-GAP with coiled-coil, ANK repeat and PH domain-containing protein n=1 Tax=Thamnophis sirtalis TaxID=35019 RepID=A0A6I9XYW2_9SAUR|nr:PREDICTED: arf-GAP with coiled-coil, ANK repeat and PH domain-containing protein 1-like [Thamnophis sirtalis]